MSEFYDLSEDEIVKHFKIINEMSQLDLCRLWRFAPVGHIYFINDTLYNHFKKVMDEKGGMTDEISKELGWEKF